MNSLSPQSNPYAPIIEEAVRLMKQMDDEPSHARQVCRLALQLFDELESLHGLGAEDRAILEAASLLHDIGWSVSSSKHHKHAARLIEEHRWKNASPSQVLQIAAVARYHRKAHPKRTHSIYKQLDSHSQDAVVRLSALLRIADGLDRSHGGRVRQVRAQLAKDHCTLYLRGKGPCSAEIWGAERKRQLWEETFELQLEFQQEQS